MSRIRGPRAAKPSPASLPAHPAKVVSTSRDAVLDEIDRRLINAFQGGFPICERPFQVAAETLGLDEATLIARIDALLKAGVLTRFGPLFNADRMGGVNVLAAMAIPSSEFDNIAEFVNLQPEIAHNYRREHALNLWFVGAAETPEKVEAAFQYIESMSGFPVYRFPKEREFFVELKLEA
jgi:DNA-binding Lrp family transcriptional regulator